MNPPILYHYTSLCAFENIVSTRKFRATHFRDLSGDPEELIFGVDRLLEAIKQKNVDEPQREYRDYLIEFVELFNRHELEVYVLSFTEKQDSRHHWKRYAPHGVAMGLCGDRVRKGFPNRLIQCRYIHIVDLPALVTESLLR